MRFCLLTTLLLAAAFTTAYAAPENADPTTDARAFAETVQDPHTAAAARSGCAGCHGTAARETPAEPEWTETLFWNGALEVADQRRATRRR